MHIQINFFFFRAVAIERITFIIEIDYRLAITRQVKYLIEINKLQRRRRQSNNKKRNN